MLCFDIGVAAPFAPSLFRVVPTSRRRVNRTLRFGDSIAEVLEMQNHPAAPGEGMPAGSDG
jgi:hypothetical protein